MKQIPKVILLFFAILPGIGLANELPDDSIYHIDSNWVDQDNRALAIGEFKGTLQVVSFVYTYCEHSCPIIISKLKELESLLPDELKSKVNFLLISLDPKRDTCTSSEPFGQIGF
jgi:protein SCO1